MADKKIEEATLAESITGTDVVPAAVGENPAPRKVTIEQIKNFTIAAIKDIAGLAAGEELNLSNDFILAKRSITGGYEEKHVSVMELSSCVAAYLSSRPQITTPSNTDAFYYTDGNDFYTISMAQVVDYVKANIGDVMDIAGLTAATGVENSDAIPSSQTRSGTASNKKVTVGQVAAKTIADMTDTTFVPEVNTEIDTNAKLLIETGGVVKKVVLGTSGIKKGGVTGPATTTADKIPQWSNNSCALKDGKNVVTSVGESGSATDDNIPTEAAVRTAVDACAKKPSSTTADKIPQWSDANGTMKDGLSVRDSASELGSSDSSVPTSLAVRDFVNGRSTVDSTVYEDIEDLPTVSAQNGDHIVCNFLVSGVARKTAFVYWNGWKFLGWVVDSIPTASQELSTLFKGIGSTLPTSANKSQLFMLSGNTTAANDGLYVATVTSASDPQWKKLTYSA